MALASGAANGCDPEFPASGSKNGQRKKPQDYDDARCRNEKQLRETFPFLPMPGDFAFDVQGHFPSDPGISHDVYTQIPANREPCTRRRRASRHGQDHPPSSNKLSEGSRGIFTAHRVGKSLVLRNPLPNETAHRRTLRKSAPAALLRYSGLSNIACRHSASSIRTLPFSRLTLFSATSRTASG